MCTDTLNNASRDRKCGIDQIISRILNALSKPERALDNCSNGRVHLAHSLGPEIRIFFVLLYLNCKKEMRMSDTMRLQYSMSSLNQYVGRSLCLSFFLFARTLCLSSNCKSLAKLHNFSHCLSPPFPQVHADKDSCLLVRRIYLFRRDVSR